MTETNIINREPSKLDYASPIQFRFKMAKLFQKGRVFCTDSKHIWHKSRHSNCKLTPLYDYPGYT